MKKIIILVGVVLVVFIIVACANNDTIVEPTPVPAPAPTATPTPTPVPAPEAVTSPTDISEGGVMGALQFNIDVANGLLQRPTGIFDFDVCEDSSRQYSSLSGTLAAMRITAFLDSSARQNHRTMFYALHWRDAYIDEFGEDEYIEEAERIIATYISASDIQAINNFFSVQELVRIETEIETELDFKDSARAISYENLIRYPHRYEGEIIRITVRITQIFDRGGIVGVFFERGFAGMDGTNEWVIKYDLPEDTRRILEGDTVTFYGIFNGLREVRRASDGVRFHIPHMTAQFHS